MGGINELRIKLTQTAGIQATFAHVLSALFFFVSDISYCVITIQFIYPSVLFKDGRYILSISHVNGFQCIRLIIRACFLHNGSISSLDCNY